MSRLYYEINGINYILKITEKVGCFDCMGTI